ncbi:MAG: hypothetical protein JWR18_870 [Segetibacter sp.]|jgi:hypothetical protein|nr:hypothetical protein [Segetibacter sp.]
MFIDNINDEMEYPGMYLKSEGHESEKLKVANSGSDENATFEVTAANTETQAYDNLEQFPYNMEGESLW